jgi:hypothetical protein
MLSLLCLFLINEHFLKRRCRRFYTAIDIRSERKTKLVSGKGRGGRLLPGAAMGTFIPDSRGLTLDFRTSSCCTVTVGPSLWSRRAEDIDRRSPVDRNQFFSGLPVHGETIFLHILHTSWKLWLLNAVNCAMCNWHEFWYTSQQKLIVRLAVTPQPALLCVFITKKN